MNKRIRKHGRSAKNEFGFNGTSENQQVKKESAKKSVKTEGKKNTTNMMERKYYCPRLEFSCRDLIDYILDHNMLAEPVIGEDGTFVGFTPIAKVAADAGMGIESIKVIAKEKGVPIYELPLSTELFISSIDKVKFPHV